MVIAGDVRDKVVIADEEGAEDGSVFRLLNSKIFLIVLQATGTRI
jgi:hypothetical protein